MRVRLLAIENFRGIKSGEADRQALAQSVEPQFRGPQWNGSYVCRLDVHAWSFTAHALDG